VATRIDVAGANRAAEQSGAGRATPERELVMKALARHGCAGAVAPT